MMDIGNLLYKRNFPINEQINVVIPTIGEILEDEDAYNDAVFFFTSMPIDFMVALDDAGKDFTSITEYELFLMLFRGIKDELHRSGKGIDTHLVLGDLDLMKFEICVNTEIQDLVLYDESSGIEIGRKEHRQIASVLRKINRLEKNRKKPANDDAKKYMIERERAKQKRKKKRGSSQLEQMIVAVVNTEQFKYDYESVRGLSIYQFNESVFQIVRKINYDNQMRGIYAGTLNPKELSQDDLNWLVHK